MWGGPIPEETVTYDYLWQAYQKEKQTNQLQLVNKTFYEDVGEYIRKLKETNNQKLYENTTSLLNSFYEKRKQKILMYVAYGKPLPQPISTRETELYNRIVRAVNSEAKEEKAAEQNKTSTLKSKRSIPEILLPSGNKIGPLSEGEKLSIENGQDMAYLIENSICEKIN